MYLQLGGVSTPLSLSEETPQQGQTRQANSTGLLAFAEGQGAAPKPPREREPAPAIFVSYLLFFSNILVHSPQTIAHNDFLYISECLETISKEFNTSSDNEVGTLKNWLDVCTF